MMPPKGDEMPVLNLAHAHLGHMDHVLRQLDLTSDQKECFDEIKTQALIDGITQGSKMVVAGIKINAEMKKDSPDKAKVENFINEFTANEQVLLKKFASSVKSAKDQLGPAQLEKLKKIMEHPVYPPHFGPHKHGFGKARGSDRAHKGIRARKNRKNLRNKGFSKNRKEYENRRFGKNRKHNRHERFAEKRMRGKGNKRKSRRPFDLKDKIFSVVKKCSKIMEHLELTDDQKQKAEEIKTDAMIKGVTHGAGMAVSAIKVKSLMKKDSIDLKAVDALIKDFTTQQTELMKAAAGAMIDFKAQLSQPQLKKLREYRKFFKKQRLERKRKKREAALKKRKQRHEKAHKKSYKKSYKEIRDKDGRRIRSKKSARGHNFKNKGYVKKEFPKLPVPLKNQKIGRHASAGEKKLMNPFHMKRPVHPYQPEIEKTNLPKPDSVSSEDDANAPNLLETDVFREEGSE